MKINKLVFCRCRHRPCRRCQRPDEPEDQIKYRKAGYSFMSWNMGEDQRPRPSTTRAASTPDQVAWRRQRHRRDRQLTPAWARCMARAPTRMWATRRPREAEFFQQQTKCASSPWPS